MFGMAADFLLGHGFGYGKLFFAVGTFHLIGFLTILLVGDKVQQLETPDLLPIIESRQL